MKKGCGKESLRCLRIGEERTENGRLPSIGQLAFAQSSDDVTLPNGMD